MAYETQNTTEGFRPEPNTKYVLVPQDALNILLNDHREASEGMDRDEDFSYTYEDIDNVYEALDNALTIDESYEVRKTEVVTA